MNQESSKTFGDQAHLLRAIEHAITYDRQAAPRSIDMQPEYGHALIRFAEDDMAAVKEWAERTGATAVHGTTTYDRSTGPAWHEFGTRPGGARGQLVGWSVDLWCVVNEPAPEPVVLDPVAGAELAAKVQAESDALPAADARTVMAEAGRAMNATGDVEVYEPPAAGEPEQDWYFTFGSGQEHDGKYVVITGTHDSARDRMFSIFGNRWSHQYAGPDRAGVEQFDLVELPESEWPTPAVDAQPAGE